MVRRHDGFTLVEVLVVMVMTAVMTMAVMELFVGTVILNEENVRSEDAQAALEQTVEEIQTTWRGEYTAYVTDAGDILHDGPPSHSDNNGKHYGWYIGVGNKHNPHSYEDDSGGGGSLPPGDVVVFKGLDAAIAKYLRDEDLFLTFHSAPGLDHDQVSTGQVILYLQEDAVPVEFGSEPTTDGLGTLDLDGDGAISSQPLDELGENGWPVLVVPIEIRMEWEGLSGTRTESRYLLLTRQGGGC